MTPAQAIAMLDRQIAKSGQTVTLRRLGSPPTDRAMQAFVRGLKPIELVGGLEQGTDMVVLSPSQMGSFPLPVMGGDKIITANGIKTVMPSPNHIYVLDVLVRINLLVSG